jgi:hypothetical protein
MGFRVIVNWISEDNSNDTALNKKVQDLIDDETKFIEGTYINQVRLVDIENKTEYDCNIKDLTSEDLRLNLIKTNSISEYKSIYLANIVRMRGYHYIVGIRNNGKLEHIHTENNYMCLDKNKSLIHRLLAYSVFRNKQVAYNIKTIHSTNLDFANLQICYIPNLGLALVSFYEFSGVYLVHYAYSFYGDNDNFRGIFETTIEDSVGSFTDIFTDDDVATIFGVPVTFYADNVLKIESDYIAYSANEEDLVLPSDCKRFIGFDRDRWKNLVFPKGIESIKWYIQTVPSKNKGTFYFARGTPSKVIGHTLLEESFGAYFRTRNLRYDDESIDDILEKYPTLDCLLCLLGNDLKVDIKFY